MRFHFVISVLRVLQLVHYEETARHLASRYLSLAGLLAISDRRAANLLMEETAERSQALKSDFEADVSDAEVGTPQELFCLFDTTFDQILVRRLVEGLPEESQEVITREARLTGNLIEL